MQARGTLCSRDEDDRAGCESRKGEREESVGKVDGWERVGMLYRMLILSVTPNLGLRDSEHTSTSAAIMRSRLSSTSTAGACQHASSNQSFMRPFSVGSRSSACFEQST